MILTTQRLPVAFRSEYVVQDGMETVTKSGIVARFIQEGQVDGAYLFEPQFATAEELYTIHNQDYVDSVISGSIGMLETGSWSPEAALSVFASTGGMRDAVHKAFEFGRSGSLSSGLHHAYRKHGCGFCTFNGIALAALEGLKTVGKVGILDLDAHYGGGTADIVGKNKRVAITDISVSPFDYWKPIDKKRHKVAFVSNAEDYMETVRNSMSVLDGSELLIYNAGMDAHEQAGGLEGICTEIIREREEFVVNWAAERDIPVLFALAGGYKWRGLTLEQVAQLHMETIRAFAKSK
jgi:acetoin utilization deacetylase AcuC-like enzyme